MKKNISTDFLHPTVNYPDSYGRWTSSKNINKKIKLKISA